MLRVVAVLLAGVAIGLSWQPYGLWPLLFVGISAFTLAIRGTRPLPAAGLGYLFGLAMLTVAVSWVHVLGTWVAAALIIFMSLFFGLLGLMSTGWSGYAGGPLPRPAVGCSSSTRTRGSRSEDLAGPGSRTRQWTHRSPGSFRSSESRASHSSLP